jgi:hypothetical protein
MLVNSHALHICLDDTNENCLEPCQEPHDEVMHLYDSDMDTDDNYMMEEDGSMDFSDDSEDDIGEAGEDEILHSVKRYGIFCVDLSVI